MRSPFPRIHTGPTYWLQICIIIVLTACSPKFIAPLAPKAAYPRISEPIFISYDNTELPLRVWMPSYKPTGVIIALHGFNDYSNFMKDSALFFNDHQLAVYAYDQRGFGETQTRGRWSGWHPLIEDLATFTALIKEMHPDTPVYILGDSMGGAVTILTMTREDAPEVDGLVLVAPAVWARSEMPFYQRFFLAIAAHTIPWKKVTGKSLKITPSDNIEMLRKLGKDPLVIKETRIDVLYGLSNLMDRAFESAEQLRSKLLLLYGEKDEIIPQEPVSSFYQRLPLRYQGRQQMILYEQGYHMLLRDLQAEIVLQDIVDWIDDQAESVSSL
jgi:acylglycerol lipase